MGQLALVLLPEGLGLLVLLLGGGDLLAYQLGPLLQNGVDPAEQDLPQNGIQHQQVDDGKEDGGGLKFQHWGRPL